MPDFLKLIQRLRAETPSAKTASESVFWFGVYWLHAAVWASLFLVFLADRFLPAKFDTSEARAAIGFSVLAGVLALLGSWRLKRGEASGVALAQGGVLAFSLAALLCLVGLWQGKVIRIHGGFDVAYSLICLVVFAQFLVPDWLAFRYLSRLQLPPDGLGPAQGEGMTETVQPVEQARFHQRSFSIAPQAMTLAVYSMICLAGLVFALHLQWNRYAWFVLSPLLLLLFLGSVVWSGLKSPFEESRKALSKCEPGVCLTLFHPRPSSGKLLIYRDGAEVRVGFDRYFLPYDRMAAPPALEGPKSHDLVLRPRLPGVPETFWIRSKEAAEILAEIENARQG